MSERSVRLAAAALVALVGSWAGVRMYLSVSAHRRAGVSTPVGEASLPTHSDFVDQPGLQPVKIPERLPDFSLQDARGGVASVRRWQGRSLVLNFWATWCAPCRREVPMLKDLSARWLARDVTVIGVAVDHRDAVARFVDDMKVSYPVLVGEEDALDLARSLGVDSPVFPFTVFTDRRGEVVALFVGELHERQADLILDVVESVNRNRLPLDEARRTIAAGLEHLGNV